MKKIFIPVGAIFIAGFSQAQLTNTENYVYTKTYITDPTQSNPKTSETVQYLDGLGRAKQVVNIKASPLERDIVSHFVYDQYGRQALDYLPVPQGATTNGAIINNPLANAVNTPLGDEIIFAKKEFEVSPLDRVLEQRQVGSAWSNKPVKFKYDANADGEVKKYVAAFNYSTFESSVSISSTSYTSGQLYKNTVTDEDGNKTIEFKNGKGQTVLVRKMLDENTKVDTYYVYNNYEQLAYVIPPLAVTANSVDDNTLNNLCYQYKYDSRNRLVEKKLPGKGWEYMVYDKADRLVATQDANLRPDSKWLVTKYDKFGRVVYTGIMPLSGQTREGLQAITNNYVITENKSAQGFSMNGMQVYYTNDLYSQIETILSVNYYDTYPTGTPSFTPTLPGNTAITDNSNQNISTKSLPVASFVKNIEDDNWTKSYTWYDNKGRAIASHSVNHLGGYTKTESLLNFSGTPLQVITKHKRLSVDTERVITENFTYDHQNRLLTHTHQIDSNPVEYLAQNEYNELSQLKTKKVGGAALGSGLQTVDYQYNIRGWMTQINDPNDLTGGDLFGYKIRYNERAGEESPDSFDTNLKVLPKYNGNIAEVDWKTVTSAPDYLRRYGYVYDGLNRLKAGFYQREDDPSATEYYEKLTYDLNGNITNLKRTAAKNGNTTAGLIDILAYNYTGNILNSVTDSSTDYRGYPDISGNTIAYDLNGNMKKHEDKGILQIDYNILNLPNYIVFNAGLPTRGGIIRNNTSHIYRADGVKLKKVYKYAPYDPYGTAQQLETKETEYLDGFQYEGQYVTIGGPKGGGTILSTSLQFVPTAEGYFDFVKNKYIYNYADHLGNTRLSYFHNGSSIEVLEENNYYPFGLKHEGYNPTAGNPAYQYKYQGQELQETGFYSFKWRNYMPDVGRFFNIDPLSEKYSYQSHYNFSENRVVDGRELEGLEWVKSTDGKTTHTHTVIRNQSSYKGDLAPIAERMKSYHEKSYSVNGVKATYSYEFNQNADPSKQFVTSLVDPIGKTSVPIKDEKGWIKGFKTSMIGGLALEDSPIINDVRVVITTNSNGDLADLEQIGQRSVHEIGHSGGLPHSWEKNSTVPLEKEVQEANAMNSSAEESPFPVPGGTNITITPKQIEKIINNPKIPVE